MMFKEREKDSAHVLHGLLPGSRINKTNKKITVSTGTSNETFIFNVGGSRFETYGSTLSSLPFSKLADENFLKKHYRQDKKDYFFDREPDVFKAILNYLRTGELHLPAWLCGASVKTELAFWGVEEDEIEECCWTNYSSWTTTLEALRKLEKDRKGTLEHVDERRSCSSSRWEKIRQKAWVFMNNPRSSLWAQEREKDSAHVLHGLLPGSRINKTNKKITVSTGTSNETFIFNVGGSRFETYGSTLSSLPFSKLADENFLKKHYRQDKKDYFFDREPDVFKAILNYLRTGELHLPAWLCGASVKTELAFWGVEEDEIEECCWTNYSTWTTTLEALRKLEKDRKGTLEHVDERRSCSSSRWERIRQKAWVFMNNPRSSLWAQVFGAISMTFVVLSIFSFCAETHDSFHTSDSQTDLQLSLKNGSDLNDSHDATDVHIHPSLFIIDVTCATYFLLEFITKFIFSPSKLKHFILPMTIIDIVALIPDIVEILYRLCTSNYYSRDTLDVLPVLRITRIFRIFRLMRHIPGLWILFYTLKASLRELLLMLLFLFVGMLVYSSLIYFADDRVMFTSIPEGFWWALITMTTVGYGDMFPLTDVGYLVGSATAISGLLMIGFTVPILVNNFLLYYTHTQSAMVRERNREERIKRVEAETKKRRPSVFLISSSKLQPKETTIKNTSSLASMADNVSKRVVKNTEKVAAMTVSESKSAEKAKTSTIHLMAETVSKPIDNAETSTADSVLETPDKTETWTIDYRL